MTKEERDLILKEIRSSRSFENAISGDDPYFSWRHTEETMCLDGEFTVDQLEALTSYMREHAKAKAQ